MGKDEVVTYALAHNRTLKASDQDVSAAGQKVKAADAGFLPRIDGGYRFQHLDQTPYQALGTTKAQITYRNASRWEVTLSQPLFTGFGLIAQKKMAGMDKSMAEQGREEARLDVVREAQYAFWQVLLGKRLVEVATENVKNLEIALHNADANFRQGVSAKNDVLKAEAALSQAQREDRTTVKQLVVLRARLNQVLDLDTDAELELTDGQEPVSVPVPDIESLYRSAEKQRPELLSIQDGIRKAEAALTAARSRYYPQVSAFAQYYREGEDPAGSHNEFANNDNMAVGLKMDWNLFEGGKTRAGEREAIYHRGALEERLHDLKSRIRVQVKDAREQIGVAQANVNAAGAALVQAEENERMTTLQYREQMVIFLEVLNARVLVAQTKADYYQALYGSRLALADLERAVGGPVRGRQAD